MAFFTMYIKQIQIRVSLIEFIGTHIKIQKRHPCWEQCRESLDECGRSICHTVQLLEMPKKPLCLPLARLLSLACERWKDTASWKPRHSRLGSNLVMRQGSSWYGPEYHYLPSKLWSIWKCVCYRCPMNREM